MREEREEERLYPKNVVAFSMGKGKFFPIMGEFNHNH